MSLLATTRDDNEYQHAASAKSFRQRVFEVLERGHRKDRLSRSIDAVLMCSLYPTDPPTAPLTAPLTWAQRLKRTFKIDISLCPLCAGQLRVIADITDPALINKILNHVQSRDPPRRPPQRALPHSSPDDLFAQR